MNEDPAQRRLIEQVAALRPSIARRCGCDTAAVDIVTDSGLTAWLVAMRQIATDFDAGPVHDWAMTELAAEPSRWTDGAIVLAIAARWLANTGRAQCKGLEQNRANVASLRARVAAGRAMLTEADLQRADAARAACSRAYRVLADEFDLLVNRTPSTSLPWLPSSATIPLVTTASVRALRPIFAARLPIPLAERRVAS